MSSTDRPTPDAPRHSTFRRRARFAAPVVVVALTGACGPSTVVDFFEHLSGSEPPPRGIVINPPPHDFGPEPAPDVVTNPPWPTTTEAQEPPVVIANPPPVGAGGSEP